MDVVAVIRHKVATEGVPIREVARELGLSRNTIRRYVRANKIPVPRPAKKTRPTPVRDEVADAAAAIWQARRSFTAGKQRLTARRLWELLREAGHTASERTVRRLVSEFRNGELEVTVPLVYAPGELAQVDFFEVWVELSGLRQKAWMFVMRLMHSGRDFAMLCGQQDTTWFLAAHVAAFTYFTGVVAAVAYDNLSAAVAKVLVGAPRVLRPRFAALCAHYAFEPRFCRPGEGHDKGGVERRGGHMRRQHLVPIPKAESLSDAYSDALRGAIPIEAGGRFQSTPGMNSNGVGGSANAASRRTAWLISKACFAARGSPASSSRRLNDSGCSRGPEVLESTPGWIGTVPRISLERPPGWIGIRTHTHCHCSTIGIPGPRRCARRRRDRRNLTSDFTSPGSAMPLALRPHRR